MASASQHALPRRVVHFSGRKGLIDQYFYLAMSLLLASIVVAGFSRTVDQGLFHATPPRPLLLWVHGAAFSTWVVFYIFQSALVRTRNVRWHRFFGWFGVALGAIMVPLGIAIAIIMGHFDAVVLHDPFPTFLSVPLYDMIAFAIFLCLAVTWRRKPELHRRLFFIATCGLMDAAFARFDFIFNNSLLFLCLDLVILLGVARDLLVDRRVHVVYRYALPALVVGQAATIYLWRGAPLWWASLTRTMLGI
jgi:hypothetical protein